MSLITLANDLEVRTAELHLEEMIYSVPADFTLFYGFRQVEVDVAISAHVTTVFTPPHPRLVVRKGGTDLVRRPRKPVIGDAEHGAILFTIPLNLGNTANENIFRDKSGFLNPGEVVEPITLSIAVDAVGVGEIAVTKAYLHLRAVL